MPLGKSDEQFHGLPHPTVNMTDTLWITQDNNRKFTRKWPSNIDADMYQALQDLTHDPRLPFQGSGSALARHFFAAGIESLRTFLSADVDVMWRRLLIGRRHLTNEQYVLEIEEQIDKQVDHLRQWSIAGEWETVYSDLQQQAEFIDGFPTPAWKRRAAQGWLKHKGLKTLLKEWETRMQDEAPLVFDKVREVFRYWEELARV